MAIGAAGFLGRLGALIGQPGVQAVVAGALTGAVGGGALIGTGVIPIGGNHATAPTLQLVSCPGSSTVLGQVTTGQPLLITARSQDGQWLQVYIGAPGIDRAWAPATSVNLQSSGDSLPVADCSAPTSTAPLATLAAPSAIPTPSATVGAVPSGGATATPRPTPAPTPTLVATAKPTAPPTPKPTPKPTPTPPPDKPPSVTSLTVTGAFACTFSYCGDSGWAIFPNDGCSQSTATINATATDPDDSVMSVTLHYDEPKSSNEHTESMTFVPATNTWQATIPEPGVSSGSWNQDNQIVYWVVATDTHGKSSQNTFPSTSSPDERLYLTSTC